jgi:hypothetical protein
MVCKYDGISKGIAEVRKVYIMSHEFLFKLEICNI